MSKMKKRAIVQEDDVTDDYEKLEEGEDTDGEGGRTTYCQRQKCCPGNVVSGSIWFMQIFAGVPWRGGVK